MLLLDCWSLSAYGFKLVLNFFFQRQPRSVLNFAYTFQVLNTATAMPAHNRLFVLTIQVPPAIVTASPINYRRMPNSQRGRSESARPSRRSKCGSWNECISGGGHIWWVKMRRNWCRDSGYRPGAWRWVCLIRFNLNEIDGSRWRISLNLCVYVRHFKNGCGKFLISYTFVNSSLSETRRSILISSSHRRKARQKNALRSVNVLKH